MRHGDQILGLKSPTLCVDLDGTLIIDEILPLLGSMQGISEEMNALTERTMNGQLPFQESFRYRVELLKEIPIDEAAFAISKVRFRIHLLETLKKWPFEKLVITSNLDTWVNDLMKNLNLNFYSSTALLGKTNNILGVDKIICKSDVISSLNCQTIFVGDGANDVEALEASNVGILFAASRRPNSQMINSADFICHSEGQLCSMLEL
jgi:phosphoserine phosphatase